MFGFLKSKPYEPQTILSEVLDNRWRVTGVRTDKYHATITVEDLTGEEETLKTTDTFSPDDWCEFEGLGTEGFKRVWRQTSERLLHERNQSRRWAPA